MKRAAKRAIAATESAVGLLAGLTGAILGCLLLGGLLAILWLPLGILAGLPGLLWGWDFGRWAVED